MNTIIFELNLKLAEMNDPVAMEKVADYYFYEKNKQKLTEYEFKRMFEYYQKLAHQGNGHAMMAIGAMYYEGVNLKQNYTMAREWYEKAATAGDVWGINNLGYCYYYGREVDVDYEKAYTYFGCSAVMGNHCGMYKLGDMYYYGKYVTQNDAKAYEWYMEAIGLITEDCPEYPNIAARIGRCLLYGRGTSQNDLEALKWLQRAELGCYRFLQHGDAFAHLSLPGIKDDLITVREKLEKSIVNTRSVVQYEGSL
ncbi:MAG: tetratricopeptide repeat protein [Eubacterium sp.]